MKVFELSDELWSNERRPIGSLPEAILAHANGISAEEQAKMYAAAEKKKTETTDTRPSDAERIRRAEKAAEPGVLLSPGPAAALLPDSESLAGHVTFLYYSSVLNEPLEEKQFQQSSPPRHDPAADLAIIRRYFSGAVTPLRPLLFHSNKTLAYAAPHPLEVEQLRLQMEKLLPQAKLAAEDLELADERLIRLWEVAQLLEAGLPAPAADCGLPEATVETVSRDFHHWEGRREEAVRHLTPFWTAAVKRLLGGLSLLRSPEIASAIGGDKSPVEQTEDFLWLLSGFDECLQAVIDLRMDCEVFARLCAARRTGQWTSKAEEVAKAIAARMDERVKFVVKVCRERPYPFPHPLEPLLLSEFLVNKQYRLDPYELILLEAQTYPENFTPIYNRVLARLIELAEAAEAAATRKGSAGLSRAQAA